MQMLILTLLTFKKVKLIFGHLVQTQVLLPFRNALTTNLMHVTVIQANLEVAFRKLPSIEFFLSNQEQIRSIINCTYIMTEP